MSKDDQKGRPPVILMSEDGQPEEGRKERSSQGSPSLLVLSILIVVTATLIGLNLNNTLGGEHRVTKAEGYRITSMPIGECNSSGFVLTVGVPDNNYGTISFDVVAIAKNIDNADARLVVSILSSSQEDRTWTYECIPVGWREGEEYLVQVVDNDISVRTLRFRYTSESE